MHVARPQGAFLFTIYSPYLSALFVPGAFPDLRTRRRCRSGVCKAREKIHGPRFSLTGPSSGLASLYDTARRFLAALLRREGCGAGSSCARACKERFCGPPAALPRGELARTCSARRETPASKARGFLAPTSFPSRLPGSEADPAYSWGVTQWNGMGSLPGKARSKTARTPGKG